MLLAFPAGKTVTVDIPILQTHTLISTYTYYRPYELRLLIFPQPLGEALKNQNAASATPSCIPLFVALRHLPPAGGKSLAVGRGRRRCCSNPPAFVSLTRKQNKKLQRSNYARAFLVGAGGLRKPRI